MRTRLAALLAIFVYLGRFMKRHKLPRTIMTWVVVLHLVGWLVLGDQVWGVSARIAALVLQLVFTMVFMVAQFVFLFWFLSQTKTTVVLPGDPKALTFADYWGQEPLVKMVKEWLYLLKDRGKFRTMGGIPLAGILLSGPPGTGKTMLAKCLAGEGEVAFIGMESSSFRAMFMGLDPQPYSAVVLTPSGWKAMGDLRVGDLVFSRHGCPVVVTDVVERGVQDIYEVRLVDGRKARATKTHRWAVLGHPARNITQVKYFGKETIRRTDELRVGRAGDAIPNVEPIQFQEAELPIPPYVLGVLLGDGFVGNSRNPTPKVAVTDEQIVLEVEREMGGRVRHHVKEIPGKKRVYEVSLTTGYTSRPNAVSSSLKSLGLFGKKSENKFIPEVYLRGSVSQRIALLQGLMDTDGSVSLLRYRLSFATTSEALRDGVVELVWSLGGRAKWSKRINGSGTVWYQFSIKLSEGLYPFRLQRKVDRCGYRGHKSASRVGHTRIESVSLVGREETRCIVVDDPDHLYVTDNYILTHNTLKVVSFFNRARALAREFGACIAFLDEIDAIGMSRGGVQGQGQVMGPMGFMGGTGALTRLLYELDGLGDPKEMDVCTNIARRMLGMPMLDLGYVMLVGSTNRPDVLDPALTRPGRLDRHIQVDLPDKAGRRAIICGYLSKIAHEEIDVEALVADTTWATPAKIASALQKDAVRLALFAGRDKVTQWDIELAMMEQAMGLQNPISDLEPAQKRQIAIHEAGHAVAQYYLRPDERIVHLTITRRSSALGFMMPVPLTDIYTLPLDRIVADIMVSLAGHVATEVVLGKYWTGASGDLSAVRQRVIFLAAHGVFGTFPIEGRIDGALQERVDEFLKDCLEKTRQLLVEHRAGLDRLVETLLERMDLSGSEVIDILKGGE